MSRCLKIQKIPTVKAVGQSTLELRAENSQPSGYDLVCLINDRCVGYIFHKKTSPCTR